MKFFKSGLLFLAMILSLVAFFEGSLYKSSSLSTKAAVNYVVTTTSDAGAGSLRQAILDANANPGLDTITFNIPGGGVKTITPFSALPTISDPVNIDATTQPGYAGLPLIEIVGRLLGVVNGLTISAGGSTVKGFAINRFIGYKIRLDTNGGNTIQANFLGTDPTGTIAIDPANGSDGIFVFNSSNNIIGGTTASARNLISGNHSAGIHFEGQNSRNNTAQGNYIGTDVTGNAALANGSHGILCDNGSGSNTIGGSVSGAGNVISANQMGGIFLNTNSNVIQGNLIGTNSAGTSALANNTSGIELFNPANNNLVGGTTSAARNLISGNTMSGILISGSGATANTVQGNFIGTDINGTSAIANGGAGIISPGGNTIGGAIAGAGNLISGNTFSGVIVGGVSGLAATVQGNIIGANINRTAPLGNLSYGVQIQGSNAQIGGDIVQAGNTIAYNLKAGVFVESGEGSLIRLNSIFSNNALGIDLAPEGLTSNDSGDADNGANRLQNFPVVTSAASDGIRSAFTGTLNSLPSASYTLDFYGNSDCDASSNGEGKTYLGSTTVQTDGSGNGAFSAFVGQSVAAGQFISATATDSLNNTSEFSQCRQVASVPLLPRPIFDFDGDGKSDISIFRPSVGEWWIERSSGGTVAFQFGNGADKIAPADFMGDSKTDIAVFRPSTGEWFVLRSEDFSYYSFPFGTNGDVPTPADFEGDGKADAAVFRPSNSTWYINNSSGGTLIQQFGQSGDFPAVADYDGDGKSDIAIYRVSEGEWWILRSAAGLLALQFGNSADKTVQGDYTGDGKADVAIWRPSTGEWFILRSENLSYYSFPFGTNGDVPAAGDYDGDGRTDAAVFRPSTSTWYIQRTSAGTLIQTFGISGDVAVPSAFLP